MKIITEHSGDIRITVEEVSSRPTTVVYTERVYLTPEAKLVIHTTYRGPSSRLNDSEKVISTDDDSIAEAFLSSCEYLGDL